MRAIVSGGGGGDALGSLVLRALAEHRDCGVGSIAPVAVGERSTNFEVELLDGERIFAKVLPSGEAAKMREQARRADLARPAGVGTPHPLYPNNADHVAELDGWSVSLWTWVDGSVKTAPWSRPEAESAGVALARIHRAWHAEFPRNVGVVDLTQWWRARAQPAAAAALEAEGWTLRRLQESQEPTDREHYSRVLGHVRWRMKALSGIGRYVGTQRITLRCQELHGDFSILNLLFDPAGGLVVTDFSDNSAGATAYEIGRIAFAPQFVGTPGVDWRRIADWLIDAYAGELGLSAAEETHTAAIVFMIHLIAGYYGLDAHVDRSTTPSDLESFWWQRVNTLGILYEQIMMGRL